MIQMICSQDKNLLAELDDKWWGAVAPMEAYDIKKGAHIRYDMPNNIGNPELVCTNKAHSHTILQKVIYKRVRN